MTMVSHIVLFSYLVMERYDKRSSIFILHMIGLGGLVANWLFCFITKTKCLTPLFQHLCLLRKLEA